MPAPFHRLTLDEFTALLDRYPFTRRINAVHMHHTWRPNHAQYRGHESIVAMWRFHTQQNGWSDIAQHVTIGPDGSIWTGRDWNVAPASASGHNGNSRAGPFMFEMIGDFDAGRDPWGGEQKRVALEVVARVQKKFDLPPESLRFHNQMGPKTCPGTQIDYEGTIAEVRALHEEDGREWPVPQVQREPLRFPGVILESRMGSEQRVRDAMEALQGGGVSRSRTAENPEPGDAELAEADMHTEDVPVYAGLENATQRAPAAATRGGAKDRFTAAVRSAMRPHVINLDRGRFSSGGIYSTSPEDVDAIFGEEMERAVQQATASGDRLRLMFYAHGGLVSESDGLWAAHLAAPWWRQNNVYPIYFVWETGLWAQLRQVLFGPGMPAAPRGLIEEAWDNSVEAAARAMRLPMDIWTNMKRSAAASVHEGGGGALRVAQLLKQFCDLHPDEVELHAVGHSAGSIFHSYFVPTALDLGVPAFRTLSLLAPAIRVDAFHERLAPRIGDGIDHTTIYTMSKDWELEDSCMGIYRKSLLYLIRNALEPEREEVLTGPASKPTKGIPILGLEESLRADPELRRIFGLHGAPGEHGEVVWSVSREGEGIRASQSRTHGGFDNDAPTMLGVAARIHGLDSTDRLIPLPREMVEVKSRSVGGGAEIELLEGAEVFAAMLQSAGGAPGASPLPTPSLQAAVQSPGPPSPAGIPFPEPLVAPPRMGRRRALCVGIDGYERAPLFGCVADARHWADTLREMSFDVQLVTESDATREGILAHLKEIIGTSRRGDVLVFQYAGHGTWLDDLDGDEPDGRDEALCPVDHHAGAYIIDDDLAAVWDLIPEGVNVTCFMDCCHSGTINRVVGGTPHPSGGGPRLRARYLPPNREMQRAHRGFRKDAGIQPRARSAVATPMREVSFAACQAREVAWENDGQGEFTRRAAAILADAERRGLTNEAFHRSVVEAFGVNRAQTPDLNCADTLRGARLLAP